MERPPTTNASRGETRITLLPWMVAVVVLAALAAGFAAKRRDSARQVDQPPAPLESQVVERPTRRDEPVGSTVTPAGPVTHPDALVEPEPVGSMAQPSDSDPEPAPERNLSSVSSYSWYEGANGFLRGLDEANRQGQALAVYFYTDWCPYCRELENELLYRARVEEFLKNLVKIRINPEDGPRERAIADEYGVRGYPSFFIQASAGTRPRKMRRTTGGRLMSPEEFVAALENAAG